MPDFSTEITNLVSGLQKRDPKLFQAISLLNDSVRGVYRELHPVVVNTTGSGISFTSSILSPANFTVVSTGRTVRFAWDESDGALHYEVRQGSDWATASFVFRTAGLGGDIDPLLIGSYTYLIKAISVLGYSTSTTIGTITVPVIAGPVVDKRVIDNNVMLLWTEPSSIFVIDHYRILKSGVELGQQRGTFISIFEQIPGDFIYSVVAVDIAGNESAQTDIAVTVNTPPDFALQDQRTSDFSGTKTDVKLETGLGLVCNVNTAETWADHFINNGFTSPQDQIDAGYPYYLEPGQATGSYEEVIDYGVVFSNILVVITYNLVNLGLTSMGVVVKMAVSLDNITYSAFTSGSVQFFDTFRYLKFRLEFTATNDKTLIICNNLVISVDVKRENDGGSIVANAADVGGTEVVFNKTFKDIESITCTVLDAAAPFVVNYDFVDVPNPVHFFVYVYDSAGVRATKTISWKARGIV